MSSHFISVIVGNDESEVKRQALELSQELAPSDADGFGLEIIDGAVNTVDEATQAIRLAIEALQTPPFLCARKLVWLKNVNFLSDNIIGKSEKTQSALAHFLDILGGLHAPHVTFLLSAIEPDKRRAFYKHLNKISQPKVYDRPDISQMGWEKTVAERVRADCQTLGIRMAKETLDYFVQLVGPDSRQIANELDKLSTYLGQRRTVEIADLEKLVPRSRHTIIFKLGNAIAQREAAQASELIEQLLAQGESPLGLLYASIIPTVRHLLLMRDLMDRYHLKTPTEPWGIAKTLNKMPAHQTEHLPKKKDGSLNAYPLAFAACDARRYTLDELKAGLENCLKANQQLVSTMISPKVVLSALVFSLISTPTRRFN